ncbi:MAG: bacteriohemerythrin [Mariprofundaceae bacterium]|nr:bacteriohemerythrin [Mariprofundaceae bacterium]
MKSPDKSTPFFAWSDAYQVGIEKIDRQHEALVTTLNRLHDILVGHGDQALIDDTLAHFIDQTKVHFHGEEEFMKLHGYPDYQDHKELHDILLRQVDSVLETQQELKSHHIRQSWAEKLELADFLREWLLSHIEAADRKLGAFLQGKKIR